MKELKKNITVALAVFITLFTLLAGYYLYDVTMYSGRWISSAYNPRLKERRSSVIPGSIFDKNGLELAGSSHDERTYIQNDDIRLSSCHVVGDIYGFSPLGAETTQGAWLLGFNESLTERIKRILLGETAHGSDLTLTLDARLNSEIAEMFGAYRGAAVVLNYKTGEILAMVSLPEFDLREIDVNEQHGGADEKALPNRALQASYVPGEVFKVVTAAAAMEYLDLSGRTFACKGSYFTEDGNILCDRLHGEQTFEEAVANYCESTLARLSVEVGPKKLKRTAESLGFNLQFLFGDTVLYESEIVLGSLAAEYDLAMTGLGEYNISVTPMHMAMLYGAIPNGGKLPSLKLISDIEGVDMEKRNDTFRKSFEYAIAEKLDEILRADDPIETYDFSVYGVSSEVFYETEEYRKLSWYAGYSDGEDCPYSIVIVMENYYNDIGNVKEMAKDIFEIIIGNGD